MKDTRGVGCFGGFDRRFKACQKCGDYTPCQKAKERAKREKRRGGCRHDL